MFSWGRLDDAVLIENYALNNIPLPVFSGGFFDMRLVFSNNQQDVTGVISGVISQVMGKAVLGEAHDALHDATSILEALKILYQNKTIKSVDTLIDLASI